VNYTVTAGDETLDIDRFRAADGSALDAKHVGGLEIITNDPRAVRYFEEVLRKQDMPSRIVIRADAP
jgi:hypothetical protein